jgi:hypothetical protein
VSRAPFHDISEPGQTLDPDSGTVRYEQRRREIGERFARIIAEAKAERELQAKVEDELLFTIEQQGRVG